MRLVDQFFSVRKIPSDGFEFRKGLCVVFGLGIETDQCEPGDGIVFLNLSFQQRVQGLDRDRFQRKPQFPVTVRAFHHHMVGRNFGDRLKDIEWFFLGGDGQSPMPEFIEGTDIRHRTERGDGHVLTDPPGRWKLEDHRIRCHQIGTPHLTSHLSLLQRKIRSLPTVIDTTYVTGDGIFILDLLHFRQTHRSTRQRIHDEQRTTQRCPIF